MRLTRRDAVNKTGCDQREGMREGPGLNIADDKMRCGNLKTLNIPIDGRYDMYFGRTMFGHYHRHLSESWPTSESYSLEF